MNKLARKDQPKRMGPRPLMLHMNTAMLAYQSLRILWPNLADGKIPFQPELQASAQKLRAQTENLSGADRNQLLQNLDEKILKNLNDFWEGVLRYQAHDYTRPKTKAKIIWKSGGAKLFDYGANKKDAPVIFLIPSLVNRYYILDLMPGRSFAHYLRAQGFRPIILDWGSPQKRERTFDIDSYTRLMLQSFDAMRRKIKGAKPAILGYCMGGVFALALAQNRPKDYSNLTLIATPWDFQDHYAELGKIDFYIERILPQFQKLGQIPVDLIQSMFFDLDPMLVVRKFQKLGSSEPA
ncbi:MAG: alpha/beta fold hydrolase, partial [Alphaproteobacteria bacterium]